MTCRALLIVPLLTLVLPFVSHGADPAPARRNVTFVATSDSHYDTLDGVHRNAHNRDTITHLNAVADLAWPAAAGGGAVERPRGVVLLGDVIDDGDKRAEGENQSAKQYETFVRDFGLDGTDGLLKFPVFEGFGNHDGPPLGREKHGFSFQAKLKERNVLRKERGAISNLSANGLHYSWDWDDVHLVQLNIYPADVQRNGVKYSATWHDPQGALAFLKEDLKARVGDSGRPVILMSHCGFDTDWWLPDDWKAVYDAARTYNVVLYLYGHSGTGVRRWAPPDEADKWLTINTGQTEKGFFVLSMDNDRLRYAYRTKVWRDDAEGGAKLRKVWTGEWIWKWAGETPLTRPRAAQAAGDAPAAVRPSKG